MKRQRAYKPREDADHEAHHCRLGMNENNGKKG